MVLSDAINAVDLRYTYLELQPVLGHLGRHLFFLSNLKRLINYLNLSRSCIWTVLVEINDLIAAIYTFNVTFFITTLITTLLSSGQTYLFGKL